MANDDLWWMKEENLSEEEKEADRKRDQKIFRGRERERKIRKITETIVVLIGVGLFGLWLYMSFLTAFTGDTPSPCIDRAGNAYYCGD